MLTPAQLAGAFTALVTPFTADGSSVDFDALSALVEAQIAGGIAGLVPCGTTGESPTLTDAEQVAVVRRTVEVAKGRVPVVAGTGSFSTKKTIASSKAALEAGADAVMVVMPYYNKPTQAGLAAHVLAVASEVKAPIVLYNIPGRTGIDLSADATVTICEKAPNVVAIKDATGNVLRCQELVRRLGDRLVVLSGDDGLTVPMMSVGARGVISVTSNVYPHAVAEVCRLARKGAFDEARAKHLALLPVHEAMFVESNPAPCKAALAHQGRMQATVRGPLVLASDAARAKVVEAMRAYELHANAAREGHSNEARS